MPDDPDAAAEIRMLDRFFDHYISRSAGAHRVQCPACARQRNPLADTEAHAMLDRSYTWLDAHMATRTWAAGDAFGMADCAAAPALFYADWTWPIGDRHPHVAAYRARLNARPSFARAIEAARPYRAYFPLGAPDRD